MSYYDLGSYGRPVTTRSPEAQTWFDRGLNWLFGYNHQEAIACFRKAAEFDPACAMAHWGISYAAGPNYNLPWHRYDRKGRARALATAYDAMQSALACLDGITAVERALVSALPARYPQRDLVDDQSGWNDDFADAMRTVQHAFADDLDVRAIFVEAIMNRTPWQMWDLPTGKVADGAGTEEAVTVMEAAFEQSAAAWDHPGLLHLYVHLMEMSPFPQRALRAGDRLRSLVPESGHLIHMPTHIDALCGHYRDVVVYNQRATVVDQKYLEREGPLNVYSMYRIHNYHFIIYGAMFLGQFAVAMRAAEELIEKTPEDLLRIESPPMADFLEGYLSMKQHVLVRFGKWQEIIAQALPVDRSLYCATTAVMLYAKAVAHSALGNVPEAERARAAFLDAKDEVGEHRRVHNNTVRDILEVAAAMVDGELEYRRGNFGVAFSHLRRAVALDDGLTYDEPWGWMQPARHALGALLLEQNRVEEAESVYRADLGLDATLSRACQHPNNLWSLHGLHECLTRRGEMAESVLISQQLELAVARAEFPVKASCYCRRDVLAA